MGRESRYARKPPARWLNALERGDYRALRAMRNAGARTRAKKAALKQRIKELTAIEEEARDSVWNEIQELRASSQGSVCATDTGDEFALHPDDFIYDEPPETPND